MKADYWHNKWATEDIGFHESEANGLLQKNIQRLELEPNKRLFLPLCGKTRDIAFLLTQGYRVVGAELSEKAIQTLFDDLAITPVVHEVGELLHYSAESIDIFVGDIFKLSKKLLGEVDAIYDRAALVALPEDMRKRYTQHLMAISATAPQLAITFEYDQSKMNGPPFSISQNMIEEYYQANYSIEHLASNKMSNALKAKINAHENAWLLQRTPS